MIDLQFFTTKQAAEYMAVRGVHRTAGTLEVARVVGGGPRFRKDGRKVIYDRQSLDEYIAARLSRPLASTSDFTQAGA